jgi:hypothetical protein
MGAAQVPGGQICAVSGTIAVYSVGAPALGAAGHIVKIADKKMLWGGLELSERVPI